MLASTSGQSLAMNSLVSDRPGTGTAALMAQKLSDSPEGLLQRLAARDRQALARMLTLEEAGIAPPIPSDPPENTTQLKTLVVGITGSGGVGKSTLMGRLIGHLRAQGQTVAALANDPQSPLTRGALLGDRIRVQMDPNDSGVFFRSLSTRGATGGISQATGPAIGWLSYFGFDVVLVETVGTGQDQIGIRPLVDVLVLVVTPAAGDEVQWEKAGVIEVADLLVVNKSDLPGSDRVRAGLQSMLGLTPDRQPPPVLPVVAISGAGVAELWQAIASQAG